MRISRLRSYLQAHLRQAVSGQAHLTVDEVCSGQPEVTTLSVPLVKEISNTLSIMLTRKYIEQKRELIRDP
jgi:hypothetical protein